MLATKLIQATPQQHAQRAPELYAPLKRHKNIVDLNKLQLLLYFPTCKVVALLMIQWNQQNSYIFQIEHLFPHKTVFTIIGTPGLDDSH